MRLARRYRWGLIKSRSEAECVFENLLKEMKLPYIQQAIFLDRSTFFIVDFLIKRPYHLAVEIDGTNHRQKKTRAARDLKQETYFERIGLKLIRFTNDEVFNNPASVRARLEEKTKGSALRETLTPLGSQHEEDC